MCSGDGRSFRSSRRSLIGRSGLERSVRRPRAVLRLVGRARLDPAGPELKADLSRRDLEASKIATCRLQAFSLEVEHDLGPERHHRQILGKRVCQFPQSGRTSIVPIWATGCREAISTASRLPHSRMSNPPIASLVSGERTVGDERLPVAHADGTRPARRSELVAGDPDAPRLEVVQPGEALRVPFLGRIGLGSGVHALPVPADTHPGIPVRCTVLHDVARRHRLAP